MQFESEVARAAVLMARAAELNAKVMGMLAENMQRQQLGKSLAYREGDFQSAVYQSGCHHNSIVELMIHGTL